ncbi:outer membrane transport energization protein ExbD [Psychroflexus salarius]|jgi:biopolymer transport protein ExbD|uniref:Outer membrane transport energization protein ExbD n=1 Tax=Psychroflexus salarius TaxID=1155689 RepID=A0A1M4VDZ2_9FLAO|nr:biopolymer transporter ExbD [Psychroflexus salarius]SHE67204.1 outer membrane transport energization protein ExbD [Psychroflexus salarius]
MNLRGRNKVSPEFSMSSMTDIVFLLLIFFMLTSPVITPEALDLILPKAKGKTTNKQNVSVSITKDLKYYVDGEQVPLKNLETALKSKLNGVEQPTVILRAEKDVILQKAVDVMSIANDNKYKLVLAVKPN